LGKNWILLIIPIYAKVSNIVKGLKELEVQAKPTETWCLFLSLFAIFLREDGVRAFPQVPLI
jgi:hypothetical protein